MNSYRSFQSTSFAVNHHQHKYFVVLKDLGPYRSIQIRIDYKVTIDNEYLMTRAFSNHMSSTTTTSAIMAHEIIELHISKRRNKNNCYCYFALCNSCFWCASYLLQPMSTVRCPSCKTQMIEIIPVRLCEFLFLYEKLLGVYIHFVTWQLCVADDEIFQNLTSYSQVPLHLPTFQKFKVLYLRITSDKMS